MTCEWKKLVLFFLPLLRQTISQRVVNLSPSERSRASADCQTTFLFFGMEG